MWNIMVNSWGFLKPTINFGLSSKMYTTILIWQILFKWLWEITDSSEITSFRERKRCLNIITKLSFFENNDYLWFFYMLHFFFPSFFHSVFQYCQSTLVQIRTLLANDESLNNLPLLNNLWIWLKHNFSSK